MSDWYTEEWEAKQRIETIAKFLRCFKDKNALIDFYRKFKFEFDFDMVENYLTSQLRHLPLFLKVMGIHFPQHIEELAFFMKKIERLSDVEFPYGRRVDTLNEKYPELVSYIQNRFDKHLYKVGEDGHFAEPLCSSIFSAKAVLEHSEHTFKRFSLSWLADECTNGFLELDNRKFILASIDVLR